MVTLRPRKYRIYKLPKTRRRTPKLQERSIELLNFNLCVDAHPAFQPWFGALFTQKVDHVLRNQKFPKSTTTWRWCWPWPHLSTCDRNLKAFSIAHPIADLRIDTHKPTIVWQSLVICQAYSIMRMAFAQHHESAAAKARLQCLKMKPAQDKTIFGFSYCIICLSFNVDKWLTLTFDSKNHEHVNCESETWIWNMLKCCWDTTTTKCLGLERPFFSQISKASSLTDAGLNKLSAWRIPQNNNVLARHFLDSEGKDLNDACCIMSRCIVQAEQLQCVPESPASVQLHPWLLQFWP